MMKILLVCIIILILTFVNAGCAGTAAVKPDVPKYSLDQVIEKAKVRADVGLDSHIQWDWDVEYLPAHPDLKLKAVWRVTQSGVDDNNSVVNQTTYFHEDTGTFTYVR